VHPRILELGPITIHSYGLMMAISFAIGIWLGARRAAARGISPEKVTDLALVILVSSIVGARILFVIPHWPDFRDDPLDVLRVWEGGLTLFGGVVLAVIASFVFMRRERLPWWPVADALAPSLALGVGIARFGCFLNGCCHGRPGEGLFCVTFPPDSAAAALYPGSPVLATQLIESSFGFLLFGALLVLDRRALPPGTLTLVLATAYGAFRFGLDFLRHYEPSMRIPLGPLGAPTVNQIVSLALVVVGVVALARRAGRRGGGAEGMAASGAE
jgi:phosphatidylglycerol:prolipoprotein diacylglycerol transferase